MCTDDSLPEMKAVLDPAINVVAREMLYNGNVITVMVWEDPPTPQHYYGYTFVDSELRRVEIVDGIVKNMEGG